MSEIICQTIDLNKKYKKISILNNINIKVRRGEIYGLIGENGAGKTTLIKILTGLIFKTDGKIILFNKEDEANISLARKKIGSIIETPALHLEMTAKQNLEIQRIQKGITDKNCIDKVLSLVNLDNIGDKKAKNFSLGMKQRLGLAIALLGDPELLILDEPLNGLDPTGIKELRELLIKLNKENGITIIISSHILSELHKLATCYGIISNGTLVEQLTASELDQKCKKHLFIKVDDINKASNILENSLNIKNFIVSQNNSLKIYEHIEKGDEINKCLAINNIYAKEITIKGDSLESYFFKSIGGITSV
ncbi:ATP-binding cassette domain-containing protein [Clostridium massiliamazoniense]|uniref:ATP-binding cassette domain-containing protein n=1 Tax=Clostridium massiliamazoniense TaxID=1347366 RepID=UPI0006D85312|nr:ATP-binding cassette domain-containing protein [Clostridium massiliamazoniense]